MQFQRTALTFITHAALNGISVATAADSVQNTSAASAAAGPSINAPLLITDETVTVISPAEALKQRAILSARQLFLFKAVKPSDMFFAEVSTTDYQGKPVTATFEKITEYLQAFDQGSKVLTLLP